MESARHKASLLAVAVIVLLAPPAGATAQFPELLLYKGKKLPLFSEPLERYFSQGPATYWDEPILGASGRRPAAFKARSTACWRGYEGTWKIEQGHLWLVALHECSGRQAGAKEIPIRAVFPGKRAPLKATWYTGVLRVPTGKLLTYVHMGFASRYQKDLLIAIRQGRVEGEKTVENRRGDSEERSPFREQPSAHELARGLMTASAGLARCARLTRQPGRVEIEIQPDGTVSTIKLGAPLAGTSAGRCLFGALAEARYPSFYGPPFRTTHQLP